MAVPAFPWVRRRAYWVFKLAHWLWPALVGLAIIHVKVWWARPLRILASLPLTRCPSIAAPYQDSDAPAWPLFVPGIVLIGCDYAAALVDLFMRPAEVTGVRILREQQRPDRAAREGGSGSPAAGQWIPSSRGRTRRPSAHPAQVSVTPQGPPRETAPFTAHPMRV